MIKKNTITSNIIISVSVQGISLILSFVLGFILPKFLNEYQYANWQTFSLYIGYVGVLHFGLLDGIVLRYSQYDYNQLDKERIRSQFKILFFSTVMLATIIIIAVLLFVEGISRSIVILVAIGIVSKNLVTYNSYSFQITNRIDKYAALILARNISFCAMTIILIAVGIKRFEWYCIADLAGDFIGAILSIFFNNGMYFGKSLSLLEAFKEWRINVSSGIMLMLANWSSTLLVGCAKMIVQWHWGLLIFGKVAFSFSLSNLFLSFVTAVSIVLFPQLKRMEQEQLPYVYRKIRAIITPVLFIAMLCYFPGCWILEKYLPQYSQSLIYLGILLPIVVYTSKVSMLTNNYLKAYRKEKAMLYVNVISVALMIISVVISTYFFDDLSAVMVWVVFATAIKSILSEGIVSKEINIYFIKETIIEAIITIAFIVCVNSFERIYACIFYSIILVVYLLYNRKAYLGKTN